VRTATGLTEYRGKYAGTDLQHITEMQRAADYYHPNSPSEQTRDTQTEHSMFCSKFLSLSEKAIEEANQRICIEDVTGNKTIGEKGLNRMIMEKVLLFHEFLNREYNGRDFDLWVINSDGESDLYVEQEETQPPYSSLN